MLGAGDRMGRERNARRRADAGAMSRTIAPLTEPTSDTTAPGLRCGAISFGDVAAGADRRADDDQIGAGDRGGVGLHHLIGEAELGDAPARRAPSAALATISRTAPCARAARAIEEPIRPTPISARRLNSGAGLVTASRPSFARKSLSAATTSRLASSVPTRHAQRVRQLVGRGLPQDQAARGEESIRVLGRAAFGFRKMDQHEIGDARRHFQAKLADLGRQPGEPARVVLARAFLVLHVLDRGDAGGDRRSGDVERAANAIDGIDDVRRAEHPSEPQVPPVRGFWRTCGT